MSLLTIPKEVLTIIASNLAENPKDLAHFGTACKKIQAMTKEHFALLLQLSQEEVSLKKEAVKVKERLDVLQDGPKGHGLVTLALMKSEQSLDAYLKAREENGVPADGVLDKSVLIAGSEAIKDQEEYFPLEMELNKLTKTNRELPVSSKKVSEQIQAEIARIQNHLKNRP